MLKNTLFFEYLEKTGIDVSALQSLVAERVRQDKKWGESNHDPLKWIAIITEELGEASESALHSIYGGEKSRNLRKEFIQIAASALAALECLNRGKWSWWEDCSPKTDARNHTQLYSGE